LIYLVDTNVWLEELLEQRNAPEVRNLLANTDPRFFALTEFSFYSIGIILEQHGQMEAFEDFLSDLVIDSGVAKIRLDTIDVKEVLHIRKKFKLDFDDAYQYVAAKKHGLTLISFDSDFDRTDLKRKTPAQILK